MPKLRSNAEVKLATDALVILDYINSLPPSAQVTQMRALLLHTLIMREIAPKEFNVALDFAVGAINVFVDPSEAIRDTAKLLKGEEARIGYARTDNHDAMSDMLNALVNEGAAIINSGPFASPSTEPGAGIKCADCGEVH